MARHILLDNTITTKTGNIIRATLDSNGLMTIAKDNADGETYNTVKPFILKNRLTLTEQEIHFLTGFEILSRNLLKIEHKEHKKIQELLNFNKN